MINEYGSTDIAHQPVLQSPGESCWPVKVPLWRGFSALYLPLVQDEVGLWTSEGFLFSLPPQAHWLIFIYYLIANTCSSSKFSYCKWVISTPWPHPMRLLPRHLTVLKNHPQLVTMAPIIFRHPEHLEVNFMTQKVMPWVMSVYYFLKLSARLLAKAAKYPLHMIWQIWMVNGSWGSSDWVMDIRFQSTVPLTKLDILKSVQNGSLHKLIYSSLHLLFPFLSLGNTSQ